jgi:hypothetical protein
MEDGQERLPDPEFLSLRVRHPTRRLRPRSVRAAHAAFAPAKPLVVLADEYYGPWGEHRLEMNAMARVV